MKIRWTLLIVLLVIALVPLLVVAWVDAVVTARLGRDLAEERKQDLVHSAKAELEHALHSYARLLDRERRLIEQFLRRQGNAAVRFATGELTADDGPVYFGADYDAAIAGTAPRDRRPPGLFASEDHAVRGEDGSRTPQMVTRDAQVIRLPPGVGREQLADDIRVLAAMTDVYRSLYEAYPEAILWQYTSLESGLHSSYPGKGGYPADYDPRKRGWYKQAVSDEDLTWISPVVDVSTGRAMLTAAMPLYRPDGSLIGVTAIDSPVDRVLTQAQSITGGSNDAEMMLLFLATPSECRQLGIEASNERLVPVVFAETDKGGKRRDWRQRVEYRRLTSESSQELRKVVGDMQQKLFGARDLLHRGEPCLWAYGPIDREEDRPTYLLLVVPQKHMIAQAAQVEREAINRLKLSMAGKGFVLALVVVLVILLAWKGALLVTRPVTALAQAAHRIADGDLEARVLPRRRCHELAELARSFNTMVPKLRDRVRIRQSLHVAMEVQQNLLPKGPPNVEGLDIAGRSIYCDETGGDYYDFLQFEQLGEHRVAVVIGDVVGHGVAAALLMATARALLRSRAALAGSLEDLFTDVNRQLCDSQFTGRFMTLFYMVMDTEAKTIRYLSAGHDPALVYNPDDDTFADLCGNDIPLGLEPDWRFHEFAADDWRSGQVILLGTDGIWECFNAKHEMFGKTRLREVIRQSATQTADAISHAIQQAVSEFRGKADQTDDITLVVVKIA